MLLRLILSLVSFAAFRFIMYSDQPDLVQLRAQIYVAILENVRSSKVAAAPDQTNLQKLHARIADEANPCTEVVCPGEGPPADQIRATLAPAEGSTSFSPKFVSAIPKD